MCHCQSPRHSVSANLIASGLPPKAFAFRCNLKPFSKASWLVGRDPCSARLRDQQARSKMGFKVSSMAWRKHISYILSDVHIKKIWGYIYIREQVQGKKTNSELLRFNPASSNCNCRRDNEEQEVLPTCSLPFFQGCRLYVLLWSICYKLCLKNTQTVSKFPCLKTSGLPSTMAMNLSWWVLEYLASSPYKNTGIASPFPGCRPAQSATRHQCSQYFLRQCSLRGAGWRWKLDLVSRCFKKYFSKKQNSYKISSKVLNNTHWYFDSLSFPQIGQ